MPTELPPNVAPDHDLGVASAWASARRRWPGVEVSEAVFASAVAERAPAGLELAAALPGMHLDDLYLALGCAARDAGAIAALERELLPYLRARLEGMGLDATTAEETLQGLREGLLVGADGGKPGILGYSARGPLRAWLRSAAARTGLRAARRSRRVVELRDSLVAAAEDDPELRHAKTRYAAEFAGAFREALAALSPADRLLLKQRLRHHLSIEDLGALYRVHPSTISRRATEARERLVAGTRDAMMGRLGVGRAEVSSILRLIRSQVDVSLSQVE